LQGVGVIDKRSQSKEGEVERNSVREEEEFGADEEVNEDDEEGDGEGEKQKEEDELHKIHIHADKILPRRLNSLDHRIGIDRYISSDSANGNNNNINSSRTKTDQELEEEKHHKEVDILLDSLMFADFGSMDARKELPPAPTEFDANPEV
jgi:hypothetical protein